MSGPQATLESSRPLTVLLLLLAPLLQLLPPASGFYIDERQSPRGHEWNYHDQAQWARDHPTCSMKAQSPIDIQQRHVIASGHLRLRFFNYNRQTRFKLQNAHHTIKMNPLGGVYQLEQERHLFGASSGPGRASSAEGPHNGSLDMYETADEYVEASQEPGSGSNRQPIGRLTAPGGRLGPGQVAAGTGSQSAPSGNELDEDLRSLPYEGAPTIKLDWLDDGNNEFRLRDIHFHWGERRDNGSEHAIDGRRAAMEMHLVHIRHGLDKSKIGFNSDSVAVVAVLIESHRKSNADFNPIVNVLPKINMTEEAQEIDYKSINDILPGNLNSFYTYSGSLTTPPCYQVVNWIVMAESLNMNAKQIEMFRNLYAPSPSQPEQLGGVMMTSMGDNQMGADHHQHQRQHHQLTELIVPNIRSLQPLNNRTILASRSLGPGGVGTGRFDTALYNGHSSSSIHSPRLPNWLLVQAILLTTISCQAVLWLDRHL